MAFGVQSIDRQTLKNNVVALAKAAKVFKIPTTITTVETQSFSGYTYPELLDVFPDKPVLERTSMNSWDDKKVRDALKANGRNKVVGCGPVDRGVQHHLRAVGNARRRLRDLHGRRRLRRHFEGGTRLFDAANDPGRRRAGDLAAGDARVAAGLGAQGTYDAVMAIVREHSGAYGMGVDYAYTMVHKAPQRTSKRPQGVGAGARVIRHTRIADMRVYLLSLGAGLLVGIVYSLLNVRSPAPPVVALVGLLGILIGEQIIPVAKHMVEGSHLAAAWRQSHVYAAHLRPPARA